MIDVHDNVPPIPVNIVDAEEARVRSAYERRELNIPKRRYSYFDLGNLFTVQERERRMLALLEQHTQPPLDKLKILEVGCGTGFWLREFIKWGARPEHLVGIDLLADRVAEAKRLCPAGVTLQCGNAGQINFPAASFDVVLQSTVFSSILDARMKESVAREMTRVLRSGGIILWHDFFINNPNNPDVRGIGKTEIKDLFPNCNVSSSRVTVAPPLARALAGKSWALCHILASLRVLDTHLLAVIQKK